MWNPKLSHHSLLSALWVFYMLNLFARDMHELGRPGMLEQIMSGVIDGVVVTEGLMLVGGLMVEFPILMTLLSLALHARLSRCLNLFAVPLAIAMTVVTNLNPDLDNLFFMAIQIVGLLFAIRIAWRWKTVG